MSAVDAANVLAIFWSVGLLAALIVVGLLSKRLAMATQPSRSYRLAYLGAVLIAVNLVARVVNVGAGQETLRSLQDNTVWLILYSGFPAAGVTLGLFVAWRYWSWLLADRD